MNKDKFESVFELLLAETPVDVLSDPLGSTFERFLQPFLRPSDHQGSVEETVSVQSQDGAYFLRTVPEFDRIFRADTVDDFVLLFDRFLIERFISWVPAPKLLIHAAVFLNSETLFVFPGGSGAGKTTLSEHLLNETDWTFLSDEIWAINPDQATVYPFPHPLNLNDPSRNSVRTLEVRDSGGDHFYYGFPPVERCRNRRLPVDSIRVIELNRHSENRWELEPLTTGVGLQRLFFHSMRPENPTRRFQRTTGLKTFDIHFHRLHYRDLNTVDLNCFKAVSV